MTPRDLQIEATVDDDDDSDDNDSDGDIYIMTECMSVCL